MCLARARTRRVVMEGSGVSVIGVSLGRRDGPTSVSQFPDNSENNREFAKFPVLSAMVGVNSSSNFNRLQGIPCCPPSGESLSSFKQFTGDSLLFAEQGIVSSEQGIFTSETGLSRAPCGRLPVFSRKIVLPKLHRPAATRRLSPGAHMVGAQISRFDRFGILYPLACAAARHAG